MGLWDWVMQSLTRPASTSGTGGPVAASPVDPDTVVATLEPAPGMQPVVGGEEEYPWWSPAGATLTELQPPIRPPLTIEAQALEDVLLSHFDGHDLSLPPLPRGPERILSKLSDPRLDLHVVAEDIAEDQVLAATVLRMANSAMYCGQKKITAIVPAVVRLGTNALRFAMLQQSMRAATFHQKGCVREFGEVLWARATAGACIMRGLARFVGGDAEVAALLGLLHDIGNVVVMRVVAGHLAGIRSTLPWTDFEYLCAECHQEFGELIADSWQLPAKIKAVIARHHDYPAADDPRRSERLQLHLADMAAALLGFGPAAAYDLAGSRAVQDLGLQDNSAFFAWLVNLPQEVETAVGEF